MFNITVGNTVYATTATTEVSVDSMTGSESSNGENLLETPEENADTVTEDAVGESEATTDATSDTVNTEEDTATTDTTTTDEANLEEDTTTTDETNVEGETTDTSIKEEDSTDTTGMDTGVNEGEVIDASGDMSGMEGIDGMEGMEGEIAATTTKDPFLSSYVPIVGITAATLVVGTIIGILLAKKKIKKGIDLYED